MLHKNENKTYINMHEICKDSLVDITSNKIKFIREVSTKTFPSIQCDRKFFFLGYRLYTFLSPLQNNLFSSNPKHPLNRIFFFKKVDF